MVSSKRSEIAVRKVAGQPSWRVASDSIEAFVTRSGGHLGPVTFDRRNRAIQPYSIAPWATEKVDPTLPEILRVLRGDFFCLPFGGNASPYRGEQHLPHGETANGEWELGALERTQGRSSLHLSMEIKTRPGRADKVVELVDGHDAVYLKHTISGMSGPMCLGHHAMLRFPETPGSGLISTSRFRYGQVFVDPVELPENRGYSFLKPGAEFRSLENVPTITGETADLSKYPALRGYEDLVAMAGDPGLPFAWTAVCFPREGYVWFALKNPRVLRSTIFWISNGGRHYPPWNGRHTGVLGVEDVTSYFHLGLKESAGRNPWSEQGFETSVRLDPRRPLEVRYVMGVVVVKKGFGRVKSVAAGADAETVEIVDEQGRIVQARVDLQFVTGHKQ